jgi:hypothetical protein
MNKNTRGKPLEAENATRGVNDGARLPPISRRQPTLRDTNDDSLRLNASLSSSKHSVATTQHTATALPSLGMATSPNSTREASPSLMKPSTVPTCPLVLDEGSTSNTSASNTMENAKASSTPPSNGNGALERFFGVDISGLAGMGRAGGGVPLLMNGYEVPDFVESAGGLQSLSFLSDHLNDIVTDTSALNLAKFTLFFPPSGTKVASSSSGGKKKPQREVAADGGGAVPMVQARIPKGLASRFQTGTHARAEDDWFDVTSTSQTEARAVESRDSMEGDDKEEATSELPSELLSGTATPSSTQAALNPSILMPTVHRRSRSSESILNDAKSFGNRVVMRQETYADLQCFRAHEYILSFFEDHGYQIDENRSSASSRSSQMSRRSSRNRIAVVHGEDFAEHSPRHIPTDEERKVAFFCANLHEMYTKIAQAYRVAGIPKGYLDALYITEVHEGTRKLRPQDARHPGLANDPVSPPLSENDETEVKMRSTEVALSDRDVDSAVRHMRGSSGGGVGSTRHGSRADGIMAAFHGGSSKKGRGALTQKARAAAAASGKRGSAYEFMLELLQKNAVHFHYQHNAMTLRTARFVRQSGNVAINGQKLRLHTWDDKKTGYLVTGVFDRTTGYPKNFKDPFTKFLYAEELKGGTATTFAVPELTRQHSAVNARCAVAEDGITLRGCSIVRQADVYSIFDGRVCGCQVARCDRDHRRTAMHAAIQSLAHYRNLFPKYPSLFRILHPQDRYRFPVVNPVGGMYCVPLIVNGATRLVKVDDFVPMDPVTGVFRCLTSSANELFPTLLEKALLKANGGGVNVALMESCDVMHQLCGWIPQVIHFLTDDTGNELCWDGMLYASEMWDDLTDLYRRGRMVMSLVGLWESEETRNASSFVRRDPVSRKSNFSTPISFPVVDVISRIDSTENKAGRRIRAVMLRDTTKDPTDAEFVPPVRTSLSEAVLSSIGYSAIHRESGVFCLTWEEATAYFDHCSVSLNPWTLWSTNEVKVKPREATRSCCHDVYDMSKAGLEMYHQPQYHICCSGVRTSTQVFVVYTPHTSTQHPLPWPCDGLSADTVDRCTNGGWMVELRVYETTSLPSILQTERNGDAGGGGRPAQTCTLDHCVGRRLTAESEGLFQQECPVISTMPSQANVHHFKFPIARTRGASNTTATVAFDVSPGNREYVVVVTVAPACKMRREEGMRDFGYTLTLYSDMDPLEQANPKCLPFVPGRAVQTGAAEDSSGAGTHKSRLRRLLEDNEGRRKLRTPTVTMHPIARNLNVNACTVKGKWLRRERAKHSVVLQEVGLLAENVWTGPQYHLHLSQPDEFCIRLVPWRSKAELLNAGAVKVLLVRKRMHQTEALEGPVAEQCDVVLASRIFDPEGAELSSVSPHTILLDRKRELVHNPLKVRQEYHAMIHFTAILNPHTNKETQTLLICYPNPSDTISWLVVRAFAEGLLISPEACRVTFNGRSISLDTELRKLITDRRAAYTFNETTGAWRQQTEETGRRALGVDETSLSIYIDVNAENTSPFLDVHFPANELSGQLVSRLRDVAWSALLAGSEQRTRTLRALSHIRSLIQQSGLTEDKMEFLLGLTRGLAYWCSLSASRTASTTTTPPLMPMMLPAGDYIIIPAFSLTGPMVVRGGKELDCAPPFRVETVLYFDLRVELIRQRVELSAIPSTANPVLTDADPQCSYLDEYAVPN